MSSPVLPWLNDNWQHLVSLHQQNKLPHALLFNGSGGVGKHQLAEHLARFLLCDNKQGTEPCGQCKSCMLSNAKTHPDLFALNPEGKSNHIKVDQIRSLSEFIYSSAQQGGYRVVIISPADAMNTSSANALLKMLEEPGQDTLIILLTNRVGQLMPTIKSRCQRLECPLPSRPQAIQWLSQHQIEDEQANLLLNICHGAPLAALAYQENEAGEQRAALLQGLADIIKGRRSPLVLAEAWQKQELESLLGWFYGVVLDIAKLHQQMIDEPTQQDCANMVKAIARRCESEAVFKLADSLLECRQAIMLNHNTNKQLMLESLLIQWSKITLSGRT